MDQVTSTAPTRDGRHARSHERKREAPLMARIVTCKGAGARLANTASASALLALILVSSESSAAIYRCTGPDGNTVYADTPCGSDAKPQPIVQAPPAPTVSPPPTSAPLSAETIAAAKDKSAREASASLCSTRAFNEWIKAQGHPLPDPNVRIAKLIEISNQCRRPLNLPDMEAPAPRTAPKRILSGPAGEAAAAKLAVLVKSGSIGQLQTYLSSPGVDINDRPGIDEALLDYAAEQNQAQIAQYLIAHGARVDAVQTQGRNAGFTALHRAAIADATEVAELLLAHGAEVNVHGPLGVTPLILAASNGSRRTAEVLLNHGADISIPTGHRETALSEATAHGHTDIVQLLLIHVPMPTTNSMNTVAARGDLDALRLMLMHDGLVHDVSTSSKDQALRFAILGGSNLLEERKQMIELLQAHGADIDNVQADPDVIPVMFATTPDMIEFMLAHGANHKAKLPGAQLAQAYVCNKAVKDPIGALRVLVAHNIDIRGQPSPRVLSAMACATRFNNSALVQFLSDHGVGVDGSAQAAAASTPAVSPSPPLIPQAAPTPSERPKVVTQQKGNITNVTLAGQLAAKNPLACIPLDRVGNNHTPPDLYDGVSACIQREDYGTAAALFALAGLESRFDAARVLDKSAGQAGQVLIMSTMDGLPDDKRAKFAVAVKTIAADAAAISRTCASIRKLGLPTYYPDYMVLHGIRAFTAKPGDPTMEPNFDSTATWNSLLTTYLNCPQQPDAPGSPDVSPKAAQDSTSTPASSMKPGLYQVKINAQSLDGQDSPPPAALRMCFNQAMINSAYPVAGQSENCSRLKIQRIGNKTMTEFNCAKDGTTSVGRSEEITTGATTNAITDLTTTDAQGKHKLHMDVAMTFLGTDCNANYPAPHSPVQIRHLRFEVSLLADGRTYHLSHPYQCRFEADEAAAFTEWQWRFAGTAADLGVPEKLPDGSRFKVLPTHLNWRPWDKNAGACPDSSRAIDSEIWVAGKTSVERFDRSHSRSEHHQVRLLESKLVLDRTDYDSQPEIHPVAPRPYVEDRPQYFTVGMTAVPAASVTDAKGLQEFTQNKQIPWLTKDGVYPFTAWGNDDVAFARAYTGIFTTEDDLRGGPGTVPKGIRVYEAAPAGNDWRIDRSATDVASQWLPMPSPAHGDSRVPPPQPASMTKAWILYGEARIEIAIFGYYRVLYDPVRDEYLDFWIDHVDQDQTLQ
jgi:ankyrin repeat protein